MERSIQDAAKRNQGKFAGTNTSNILILTTLLIGIVFIYSLNSEDPAAMMHRMNQQNHWLILVTISFVLMFLCALTPMPAEAVTIANGIVFGPVLGTLVTWVSAMVGDGITFLYGRYILEKSCTKFTSDTNYRKLDNIIHKWGNLGLVVARLVPVVPFFALNIGAAFLPISTRNYFLITGVCILPHIIIICFFSGHLAGQ